MAARGAVHTQQPSIRNYAEGTVRSMDGTYSIGTLSSSSKQRTKTGGEGQTFEGCQEGCFRSYNQGPRKMEEEYRFQTIQTGGTSLA